MSKRFFLINLVLSVVITYVVAILDALRRDSLLAGEAGIPFRFSSSYFFGESTNLILLLLDVAVWFLVIWMICKISLKIKAKK